MNHIKFNDNCIIHDVSITEVNTTMISCKFPIATNPEFEDAELNKSRFESMFTGGILVIDDNENLVNEYYGYINVGDVISDNGNMTVHFLRAESIDEYINDIYKRLTALSNSSSNTNNINAMVLLRRTEELTRKIMSDSIS